MELRYNKEMKCCVECMAARRLIMNLIIIYTVDFA